MIILKCTLKEQCDSVDFHVDQVQKKMAIVLLLYRYMLVLLL